MDEEKLLDLQVALLLVQAAHSGEPLEALKENLNHHHLAELHCELSSGPGKPRWLLAITDPRATVDKSQSKNSSIKEGSPAVFLAVNALPMGPTGELERTIASYWMGLDNLGANNAEGNEPARCGTGVVRGVRHGQPCCAPLLCPPQVQASMRHAGSAWTSCHCRRFSTCWVRATEW